MSLPFTREDIRNTVLLCHLIKQQVLMVFTQASIRSVRVLLGMQFASWPLIFSKQVFCR